jgi:CheY-like chemotaxis protein
LICPPRRPSAGRLGRLLVIDDEAALRKLLEAVLTKFGYEVETAQGGAEAIAMCENARASGRGFDAALLKRPQN